MTAMCRFPHLCVGFTHPGPHVRFQYAAVRLSVPALICKNLHIAPNVMLFMNDSG